jgi:RNA polymerase sigma factor (sigma-70 family)
VSDERRQLINLAYRLLGSMSDAEDAVQETFARWYALAEAQRAAVGNPAAWRTTVAGRVCLDVLGSARVRRERYVGEWIPEPLPSLADDDPADRVTLDESVSMAFLVVLESMTPAERVAFVLHDVYRYRFDEIAEIVGRSPAACRQLASSARRRIRADRPLPTAHADVVRKFKRAWERQDIDALIGLLDPSATAVADGGGRAQAQLAPTHGAAAIAQGLIAVLGLGPVELLERTVNGQPGLVMEHNGVIVTVMAFRIVGDAITHIWAIRNPDKLKPWVA